MTRALILAVAAIAATAANAGESIVDCYELPNIVAGWYAKDTTAFQRHLDEIGDCLGQLPLRDARFDDLRRELLSAKGFMIFRFNRRQLKEAGR